MKTIFFVIATWQRANFILRTGIFRILKAKGFRMVIISPFGGDKDFIQEFAGVNVVFEPLCRLNKFESIISNWRSEALIINTPRLVFSGYVKKRVTRRLKKTTFFSWLTKGLRRLVFFLLPAEIRLSPSFWEKLEAIFSNNCCTELFRKYRPAAVILSSAGTEGCDIPFIVVARKLGVTVFATDNNIDAFEFRYFSIPRRITKWALFSEVQKKQAIECQSIPEKLLVVTGPARYDYYVSGFRPAAREDFFSQIGADPAKLLITFGTKLAGSFSYNADIIKILLEAIRQGRFGPAQLLVRYFATERHLVVDKDLDGKVIWEKVEEVSNREHIANLLYYSSVVISVGSTMCVEACMLDRPAIWIGFDGFDKLPETDSLRLIYKLETSGRILATGGIPLATGPEHLIELVKRYLDNPQLDSEKRRALLEQEYYKLDGRAGERIAEEILKTIQ